MPYHLTSSDPMVKAIGFMLIVIFVPPTYLSLAFGEAVVASVALSFSL